MLTDIFILYTDKYEPFSGEIKTLLNPAVPWGKSRHGLRYSLIACWYSLTYFIFALEIQRELLHWKYKERFRCHYFGAKVSILGFPLFYINLTRTISPLLQSHCVSHALFIILCAIYYIMVFITVSIGRLCSSFPMEIFFVRFE